MEKKQKRSLGILSFLFPSVPIILVIAYFIFSAAVTGADEGWMVFYGAIFLLIGLTFLTPLCGGAGLVCGILDLRRHGIRVSRIAAIVLNILLLAVSIPLALSFISNT